jgi:hypothetical protein
MTRRAPAPDREALTTEIAGLSKLCIDDLREGSYRSSLRRRVFTSTYGHRCSDKCGQRIARHPLPL